MFYKVDFQGISDHIQHLTSKKKSRLRRRGGQKCQNQSPNYQNFRNFGAKKCFLKYFLGLKSFNATEKIFEIKKSPLWESFSPCSQQFENTFFTRKLAQYPEIWSKFGVEKWRQKFCPKKWRKIVFFFGTDHKRPLQKSTKNLAEKVFSGSRRSGNGPKTP